jgi:predicted nuclease with RNAse H fold
VYLRALEQAFGVTIRRVGIDAPSAPSASTAEIRRAEQALDERGISYIQTPSEDVFASIAARVRAHLNAGGAESRLPGANQLWMLFGFELYRALSAEGWNCLEVYPQATVRALGAGDIYKAASGGADAQLRAVAHYTGWPEVPNCAALKSIARGKDHDRLDAYLAAWVAALGEDQREALGSPPNDAIWIPRLEWTTAASLS